MAGEEFSFQDAFPALQGTAPAVAPPAAPAPTAAPAAAQTPPTQDEPDFASIGYRPVHDPNGGGGVVAWLPPASAPPATTPSPQPPAAAAPVSAIPAQEAPAPGEFSYADAFPVGGTGPDGRPTSQSLGFMENVTKPLDNVAGWLNKIVPDDALAHVLGMKSTNEVNADRKAAFAKAELTQRPGLLGSIGGGIVGTLPTLALPGGALVQGAAAGASLTDHPDNLADVAKDAAAGAVGSYVGGKVVGAIGKAASPVVRPAVQRLIDAGVQMTPGQIAGGPMRTIEDSLTSWPILGDMIKNAKTRSVATFNTAASNDALAHIGETVPSSVNPGRDTIAHVESRLGNAYDQIKPQLSADMDPPFLNGVVNIRNTIQPEALDAMPTFDRVFKDEIVRRMNPTTGALDGQAAKDAQTAIGQEISGLSPSPDPKARAVVRGLKALQSELDGSLMRNSAPGAADRLADINAGYAKYARLRTAAANASDKDEGLFTPYQLGQAVKQGDKTVGKGARAKGQALMQDLATAGQQVLPSTVPDSGTVGRGLIAELPMLLGFGSESKNFGRQIAGLVMGGPALGLPYTAAGGRLAQKAMTARPWTPAQAQLVLQTMRPAITDLGAVGSDNAAKRLPQLPRRQALPAPR